LVKKYFLKQNKKIKLIYDSHEYWPANYSKNTHCLRKKILEKIMKNFEKKLIHYVDYVITANQIVRGYILLLNRNKEVEVIYNSAPEHIFKPEIDKGKYDQPIICHEGSLNFGRGLKKICFLVKRLKINFPNIQFLIIGETFHKEKQWLYSFIKNNDLKNNIKETGWLPYEKVPLYLKKCAIGLVTMENTASNMLAGPPNKLFNYALFGCIPVSFYIPETARIIKECQLGLVVERNIDDIFRGVKSLLTNKEKLKQYAANTQSKHFKNLYSWKTMEKKLFKIYDKLTN